MLRKLGQNYQIALPREIVNSLHLKMHDYLEIHVEDNKVILEPQVMIPRDQAYFYTPEWQKGEKEAAADIKAGRVTKNKNVKELIKILEKLARHLPKDRQYRLPTKDRHA